MTARVPEPELAELKTEVAREIEATIARLVAKSIEHEKGTMYRIQPPSTIIALAAEAAAAVVLAFERGYRMG